MVDRSPPSLAIDYISCLRSFDGWPGGRAHSGAAGTRLTPTGRDRIPDPCYRLAVIPIAVVIAAVIVIALVVV
jgi:hypothetical protein